MMGESVNPLSQKTLSELIDITKKATYLNSTWEVVFSEENAPTYPAATVIHAIYDRVVKSPGENNQATPLEVPAQSLLEIRSRIVQASRGEGLSRWQRAIKMIGWACAWIWNRGHLPGSTIEKQLDKIENRGKKAMEEELTKQFLALKSSSRASWDGWSRYCYGSALAKASLSGKEINRLAQSYPIAGSDEEATKREISTLFKYLCQEIAPNHRKEAIKQCLTEHLLALKLKAKNFWDEWDNWSSYRHGKTLHAQSLTQTEIETLVHFFPIAGDDKEATKREIQELFQHLCQEVAPNHRREAIKQNLVDLCTELNTPAGRSRLTNHPRVGWFAEPFEKKEFGSATIDRLAQIFPIAGKGTEETKEAIKEILDQYP